MALKKTLAEFMGVSEEWLAGYEAAKAEERTCKYKHIEGTWHSCEICNYWHDGVLPPRYCPNCGAKVVG